LVEGRPVPVDEPVEQTEAPVLGLHDDAAEVAPVQ
jgi:hypothetical protein